MPASSKGLLRLARPQQSGNCGLTPVQGYHLMSREGFTALHITEMEKVHTKMHLFQSKMRYSVKKTWNLFRQNDCWEKKRALQMYRLRFLQRHRIYCTERVLYLIPSVDPGKQQDICILTACNWTLSLHYPLWVALTWVIYHTKPNSVPPLN